MEYTRLKYFDPRLQLIVGILSISSILFIRQINASAIWFALLLLILFWILIRDQLLVIFKEILRVYPMLLLITFHLPFQGFNSTEIIGHLGSFTIYSQSTGQFFSIHLKSFFLLNISFALSHSLSHKQAIAVLDYWHLPDWMISIYSYLHRLLQVFGIEVKRMKLAIQARNFQLRGFRSILLFSNFLMVYLFRVSERSDRSYQAMISRGFYGHFPVTLELNWKLRDTLFLIIIFLLTGNFWICRIVLQ